MEIDSDILKIIVEAIVSVSAILIARYLIPWLKSEIGDQKYSTIQEYCELAVRSAEQLYSSDQWKEKKAYVLSCITAKLHDIGLELSDLEVNAIIEGIVQAVKKG